MAEQQKIDIEIPDEMTRQERVRLADAVIEFIVDRTQRGVNKRGGSFPAYSKKYIDSLDFLNAGKNEGEVNLTLSGDMLAALQLLRHEEGKLTIGFDHRENPEENAKAEGNIKGTYGQATSTGKKRDFLGITKKDLAALVQAVRRGDY